MLLMAEKWGCGVLTSFGPQRNWSCDAWSRGPKLHQVQEDNQAVYYREPFLFMKSRERNLESSQMWLAIRAQLPKQESSTSHSAKTAGTNPPAL